VVNSEINGLYKIDAAYDWRIQRCRAVMCIFSIRGFPWLLVERIGCTSAAHKRDQRLRRFSRSWKAAAGCNFGCATIWPPFSPDLSTSRSGASQTLPRCVGFSAFRDSSDPWRQFAHTLAGRFPRSVSDLRYGGRRKESRRFLCSLDRDSDLGLLRFTRYQRLVCPSRSLRSHKPNSEPAGAQLLLKLLADIVAQNPPAGHAL
jgi:hypothetical protein